MEGINDIRSWLLETLSRERTLEKPEDHTGDSAGSFAFARILCSLQQRGMAR
jgi:hypothetical protein